MALSIIDLQTPLLVADVRDMLMEVFVAQNFPVTAWEEEGPGRAFVEASATYGAYQSEYIALLAQMVYNPTATNECLTNLSSSHFDNFRAEGIASVFDVPLVNSGAIPHSILAVGDIVLKASNGQTFTNTGTGTIAPNATTVFQFKADVAGALGNVSAQSLFLVTQYAGVTAPYDGNLTTAGADPEIDENLRVRNTTKWATLRVEKTSDGVLNLARSVVPTIHSVGVDHANPRGPGTVDVYLAAANATAGTSDVATVQAALDDQIFGNGVSALWKAFPTPTQTVNLAATIYYKGVDTVGLTTDLEAAWRAFLLTIPIGGFDLSPGPTNIIMAEQISDILSDVNGVRTVRLTTPATSVNVAVNTKVLEGTITLTLIPVKF